MLYAFYLVILFSYCNIFFLSISWMILFLILINAYNLLFVFVVFGGFYYFFFCFKKHSNTLIFCSCCCNVNTNLLSFFLFVVSNNAVIQERFYKEIHKVFLLLFLYILIHIQNIWYKSVVIVFAVYISILFIFVCTYKLCVIM